MLDATSTTNDVIAGRDLSGHNAVVTGGTAGLGYETARALASAGASVLLAGRNQNGSVARLRAATGSDKIDFAPLDLGRLASVREFCRSWDGPLHLLINNAGVMATPLSYTADGFETQFGVNHLGHFALAVGLFPALRAAGTARVVALSSRAHRRSDVNFDDPNYRRRPYDPWEAYGQSKSADALFAVGLTKRWKEHGIIACSVMPGAINTGLQDDLDDDALRALGWVADQRSGRLVAPPAWKTVEQGAATTLYAAVAPGLAGGEYLDNCAVASPWTGEGDPPNGYYLPRVLDPDRAWRLWDLSAELTAS